MGKIEKIKEKYDLVIDPVVIADMIDKSKTKKYVEHMLRFTNGLVKDYYETLEYEMNKTYKDLRTFDEMATNGMIENADISKYKRFEDILVAMKEGNLTKSIGKAKKEIKILFEDDNYMLFLPLSYDAAAVYGKGTKWCVTQNSYFYRYADKGILCYFIDKKINRKIGLYYDMDISYFYSVLNKEQKINGKSYKTLSHELLEKSSYDDYEDTELLDLSIKSNKFSCWTSWDSRIEMTFTPIPQKLKELFINFCSTHEIQNASYFNDVEKNNLIDYYECNENIGNMVGEEPQPMMEMYDEEQPMMEMGMIGQSINGDEMYEDEQPTNYDENIERLNRG